jgi:hypothetical protein
MHFQKVLAIAIISKSAIEPNIEIVRTVSARLSHRSDQEIVTVKVPKS